MIQWQQIHRTVKGCFSMTSADPSLIFRSLLYSTRRTHPSPTHPTNPTISYCILPYLTFSLYSNIILFTNKATQSSDPIKAELKAGVFYPPNSTPRTTKSHPAPHRTAPTISYRTLPYSTLPYHALLLVPNIHNSMFGPSLLLFNDII